MAKPSNEVRLEKRIKAQEKRCKLASKRLGTELMALDKLDNELFRVQQANQKAAAKLEAKQPKALKSFGVKFIRRKALSEIKAPGGWASSPGKVRVSDRRFASSKEANHHGKRFTKIEGHKSFSVFRSADRVNAWVNWATGKTNPVVGLRRKNRG